MGHATVPLPSSPQTLPEPEGWEEAGVQPGPDSPVEAGPGSCPFGACLAGWGGESGQMWVHSPLKPE